MSQASFHLVSQSTTFLTKGTKEFYGRYNTTTNPPLRAGHIMTGVGDDQQPPFCIGSLYFRLLGSLISSYLLFFFLS